MSQEIYLTFTRDFTLCTADFWHWLLSDGLKKEFGFGIYNQIMRFNGRAVEAYRSVESMKQLEEFIINKDINDDIFSEKSFKEFQANIDAVVALINKIKESQPAKRPDFFDQSVRLFKLIYPYIVLSNFLPSSWRDDFLQIHQGAGAEAVLKRWYEARVFSEGKFEMIDAYWREMIGDFLEKSGLSRSYRRQVRFAELEDMIAGQAPPEEIVLKTRQAGYILYQGELITGVDFAEFLKEHDFDYPDLELKKDWLEIRGQVASSGGVIAGSVQTVMNATEVADFRAGNILVTTMTVPEFVPAMKKAKAIITDEGGITCHAAIVSRELKIPCIIGTRVASKVLVDGDEIEANFQTGIIKKIK